jgi:uncharacterized protein
MNLTSEQTILITAYKVKSDAAPQFAEWQQKTNAAVSMFPGFISLEMLPPQNPVQHTWTVVQRFRSHQDLKDWRDSEQRSQLHQEVIPLLIQDGEDAIQEIDSDIEHAKESVTEVFVTHVKPGMNDAYRTWASKIQQIEAEFPGYQGVYIQAPLTEKGNWITIVRFDTPEHLDNWLASDRRKEVLKEAEEMVADLQSHRVASPFAGWFSNITKSTGEAPAVWKQTMLILLVLFPIVMFEFKFLNPLTKGLNISLATFIGNAISVTLVSWPMLPISIYFLGWWLSPGIDNRMKKNIIGTLIVISIYIIEIIVLWNFI